MNDMICAFASLQRGFPVDVDLSGDSEVARRISDGDAMLIVTVHTRLSLAINALFDTARPGPIFAGVPPKNLVANSWGRSDLIEVIHSQKPTVLLRIQTALKSGRTVVAFVDYRYPHKEETLISPNLFRLAERLDTPLVYALPSLGARGQIIVDVAAEPPGVSGADARANAFIRFLDARSTRNFEISRPKSARTQPKDAARSGN